MGEDTMVLSTFLSYNQRCPFIPSLLSKIPRQLANIFMILTGEYYQTIFTNLTLGSIGTAGLSCREN